jgi:PST family polysaccharide transporter
LFGAQWIEVIPLIKIFSLMIPIQAVLSTSGSFFQVLDKPKMLFWVGCLSSAINILAIVLGIQFANVELVASFLVISFALNFLHTYYFLFKYGFQSGGVDFIRQLVRSGVYTSAPLLVYIFVKPSLIIFDKAPFVLLWNTLLLAAISLFFLKLIRKSLSL